MVQEGVVQEVGGAGRGGAGREWCRKGVVQEGGGCRKWVVQEGVVQEGGGARRGWVQEVGGAGSGEVGSGMGLPPSVPPRVFTSTLSPLGLGRRNKMEIVHSFYFHSGYINMKF